MSLFIVATPIGNLDDITLRAIDVLQSVDYVVCEDSRRTGILLHTIQSKIKSQKSKLVVIHEHSSDEKIDWLVGELKSGKSAALCTDAGTPGIADPGGRVVEKAIEAGIDVVPIPGPSSLAAILSIAGWQNEPVLFVGYLPKKKGRQSLFKAISNIQDTRNKQNPNSKFETKLERRDLSNTSEVEERSGISSDVKKGGAIYKTIVFFESPFRINKTIKELEDYLDENCQAVIARELTKQFEEIIRGTLGELSQVELKEKGEFTVAIHM